MVITLNQENFKDYKESFPLLLVDFWAPWCGPCKMLGPVLDDISEEYTTEQVVIGKINVDEEPDITVSYGIRNVPTILLFKGDEIVDKLVGAGTRDMLKALINKHLNGGESRSDNTDVK